VVSLSAKPAYLRSLDQGTSDLYVIVMVISESREIVTIPSTGYHTFLI
jgi:hypothetical protein